MQRKSVAAWLQQQGLSRGDRIAIMMPNVMAYAPILFGILKAGLTVVNVNPLYTRRELSHQLNDSGAKILFVLENFAATVEKSLPDVNLDKVVLVKPGDFLGLKGTVINLVSRYVKKAVPGHALQADQLADILTSPGSNAYKPAETGPEDIAFLQYTGGTTGLAKGATLTHFNVAANVAQLDAWMGRTIAANKQNVMITALPLYHIFALTACCLFLHFGTRQLLIANPRDIDGFVKTLKSTPFTCTVLVNTLYNALANHPQIKDVDFSRLTLSISGGMATQKAVARKWKDLTGSAIIEGYGLSETSPVVCANPMDLDAFSGTIGYPIPSTEVTVRDEDGKILGHDEEGELCVRGPQVMAGYWNKPEETARVMTDDGFFRTGDIAVIQQDGQVRIVDRIKGHGAGLRLQRLSERSRGCAGGPSEDRRSRRHRRARRTFRRSSCSLHRAQGREPDARGSAGILPREPHRLQDSATGGIPRFPAQDQCRQDAAPGPARGGSRQG